MPHSKAVSVFVLLTVAVALFYLERRIEHAAIENEVSVQQDNVLHATQDLRIKLTAQISEAVYVLSGLRAFIEANPDLTQSEFKLYAESIRRLKPSIKNIAAAPDMVIRYVWPLQGNEASLGLDYRKAPVEQRAAAFRALRESKPIIAGPVELVQGGVALIVRLPVYVKAAEEVMKEWGILAAVIDIDEFYQRAGIMSFVEKYDLSLRGTDGLGDRGPAFFGKDLLFDVSSQSVILEMELVNGSWIIAVKPKEGWPTEFSNQWVVRLSFITAFFIFSITLLTVTGYLSERGQARRREALAVREKSEFLEILSHEIRSPLQGVLGAQKFLLDNNIDEELRSIVETAHQSGEYINSLINDYLDLQRAESGGLSVSKAPADIRGIIENSFRIVTAGKKSSALAMNFSIAEDVPFYLMLDERKVRQVLVNIIGNALKYTNKGFVSVTARYTETENPPVLILKVEDTGIGIEKKDLATLFDRFTRSKRGENKTGSGLGLAIAKSLVVTMGGKIEVESDVGQGTAFIMSLPAVRSSEEKYNPSDAAVVSSAAKGPDLLSNLSILVADDVVVNRILINAMLVPLVKNVVVADDGHQVLEELDKGSFDLIIMDVNMPKMNGVAATKHIRSSAKHRDIPIIGLTGEDSVDFQKMLFAAGMNAVLTKPINLEPLLATIREQLLINMTTPLSAPCEDTV
ncbi:MAG: ATP-binding protein [Sneathiella sp.]